MKKTHIIFSLYLIASASLVLAGDIKKHSQLEKEIAQLNEDIRLIDCELGKKVTTIRYPGGSTCTNFDISSKESMDLLGKRAVKCNALKNKQQELASLLEKQ